MKNKTFLIPLLTSFGTMVLLYLFGFIFNLTFFEFKVFQNTPLKGGLIVNSEVSLHPILIGLVVGFIVERVIKTQNK